jgi:hypothetical protein
MSELPSSTPSIDAIFETYQNDQNRPHLGASQIGEECERKLWYSFRHCLTPAFDGRMLRLFETGRLEEERVIRNLRKAGFEIWDVDPETKKQFRFEMWGGHFSGSLDGVGMRFLEAPKTPHVIEIKTSNNAGFTQMLKKGVLLAKPTHYAQMQIYMSFLKLTRAYYIMVNKDNDKIYGERVEESKSYADILIEKAERIIFASEPGEKLGDTEKSFCCKFCDYHSLCWSSALPDVNCRTCCHVTPERDGGWSCAKGRDGPCELHIYIPALVPMEIFDAGEDWIEYVGGLRNGPGYISSGGMRVDKNDPP